MKIKLPDGTEIHGTYEEVKQFVAHIPMQILDNRNHKTFKMVSKSYGNGMFVDMTQTYGKTQIEKEN